MSAVTCELCPRACVIPEGAAGDCRVRVNLGGKLRATTYGRPSAIHIDPMEKKPLYHFHPGSPVFSLATAGCNLHCLNCQNWQLSQRGGEEMEQIYRAGPAGGGGGGQGRALPGHRLHLLGPHRLLRICGGQQRPWRSQEGLANVFVTAAYINREAPAPSVPGPGRGQRRPQGLRRRLLPPGQRGDPRAGPRCPGDPQRGGGLGRGHQPGDPDPQRRPGLDPAHGRWIRDALGADTPLHFSRFQPQYRLRNLPPTPGQTLERARGRPGTSGLHYVYMGNVLGDEGNATHCPRDGTLLIRRVGFFIVPRTN